MIVGVPTERIQGESRVSMVPAVAAELIADGHEVLVTTGAGESAHVSDHQYREVGCEVVAERSAVFERADVILQVRGLGATDKATVPYREGQIAIGLFAPYELHEELLQKLANRNVNVFSLELLPRISRAQSMDALTSQSSLAGYQAVLLAAQQLPKLFPMEMTAAGTVRPAEIFVIGAGVAGLKAIATAERLGASTTGYDIRLEVKREVESLGADFLELDLETEESGDDEGYAQEMDEEFYAEQRRQLERVVPESDVIITTAAIPGAPAPELVSSEMIATMDEGSVIVDLSAPSGGNCEPTKAGMTVQHEGVTIVGPTNLPSNISRTASRLYATNLSEFLDNLIHETGAISIDLQDEIIDSTLLTYDGTIRNPHIENEETSGGTDENEETSGGTDETGETSGGTDETEETSGGTDET